MKVLTALAGKPYVVLAGAAVIAISAFAFPAISKTGIRHDNRKPVLHMKPASIEMTEGRNMLVEMEEAFTSLAEAASPAVVHISPANDQAGRPESDGQGSGFVYTSDGWIITNDHVVAGAKEVMVTLANQRQFKGKVYSPNDLQIDLAMVKIDASGLNTLTLGTGAGVKPGQFAVALGSPFNLENTVTIGHISAINRPGQVYDPRLRATRLYSGMIQTDASINPGNSGGPLLNLKGEVIGINSSIISSSTSSAGIGFAIPAKTVQVVADEIIKNRKFDRGLIGIIVEELKPYELTDMKIPGGARAHQVTMDGPAFKSGLRDNDIIIKIGDEEIKDQSDLLRATYLRAPGDTVPVTYIRGGKTKTVSVKLADPAILKTETPQTPAPQSAPRQLDPNDPDLAPFFRQFGDPEFFPKEPRSPNQEQPTPQNEGPKLGAQVEELDGTNRSQFKVPAEAKGVLVTIIRSGGSGERAGLKEGDVIQSLNGKTITNIADLTKAMSGIKWGDRVVIKVLRESKITELTVRFN